MTSRVGAYDVVVIGGSQAGLAIGHHLAQSGTRFVSTASRHGKGVIERHSWPGLYDRRHPHADSRGGGSGWDA